MKLRSLSVCVTLLPSLGAQDTPASVPQPPAKAEAAAPGSRRPRIGLVLEGGGALGLAHVGVIKWLEENRIPVDVIAGTSMGALVGGIYASGESPDQIAALIRNIQWTEVLRGVTPYADLSFRRKEDRRGSTQGFSIFCEKKRAV